MNQQASFPGSAPAPVPWFARGPIPSVTIVEVGPRDGLQNESAVVSTRDKIAFVDRLTRAGLPVIEVGAFVSPAWVPQMADTAEVLAGILRADGVRYTALVPNRRGLERARAAQVSEVAIFAAASETFSRKNINQGIEESLATYRDVCETALTWNMKVRAYLSTSFGCPYEGTVPVDRVVALARRLIDLGAFEVAVSDTIGIAQPGQVRQVVEAVAEKVPSAQIALHFHDTRGTALANVLMALGLGITTFDASAGGLGGCPYAPGAAGNLATEDLVYMLDGLGIKTGVALGALMDASGSIEPTIGHPLPSRYVTGERARAAKSARARPAEDAEEAK